MKFEVWYVKEPNFGFGPRPSFPADYVKAAEVEVDRLDEVFRVTNHIDEPWWKNPEVVWRNPAETRSMSVGDVAVEVGSGKAHYVEMSGWSELEAA